MSEESFKIENPTLFVFAILAFVLSVGLLILGILRVGSNKEQENLSNPKTQDEAVTEGGKSISDYFKNNQVNIGQYNDKYIQDDPFRESCSGKSSKGVPAVTYGTVCFR